MTVVFFLSGHGFGHASRQVEIINALGRRNPGTRIVIRSAVNAALLHRTLQVPCALMPGECDTGVVQTSSVAHDDEATRDAAQAFYASFDGRTETEVEGLAGERVDLVVGDIPPLAFAVAARLGVPSVAIGNFTWDWIYETYPGFDTLTPVLGTIRSAYGTATRALELPFSGGFDIFPRRDPLPLVARHATREPAEARRHFGLPASGPVALLSFGGYGLPALDLGSIDALGAWTVVTTDRIAARPDALPRGVVHLSEERFLDSTFRYEDLVSSVDVVLTKPGYGIIAECIANGTSMLYTSRGAFREYDVLVEALPRYVRSAFISQADLFAGRWQRALDCLADAPAPPQTMRHDGAEVAAQILASMV